MAQFADFISLAESFSGSAVVLSGSTIALLLTSLGEGLESRGSWAGSGDFSRLTDGEWDEIEMVVSLAERELMKSGLTGVFSCVAKVPSGALLCDGSTHTRADYPDLYEAWGGTSLIIDSDTFQVPDLRDKFVIGASVSNPVLSSGGEASHVLTEMEMPTHSHSIGGSSTGLVVAPGELPVMTPLALPTITGNSGGGQAHNNIPPFVALMVVVWI